MVKPPIVWGNLSFREEGRPVQKKKKEWTRVECQYSRKRFKKIDFFAPGGQKFDTIFLLISR
jgi:hypothetical protein